MSDFLTTERLGPQQSLTPEGFLVIRAVPLARTGPQLYSDQEIPIKGDAGGRIVIDREPDEVFSPATIASLNGKPVTLDHPDDDVDPTNYADLAVGTVLNVRRGQYARDNLLYGDLVIHHPDAIKAIRDKVVRELSVGYRATYQQTGPGRGRQTGIICNHLALVSDGRCGPACTIGDRAYFTKDQHMPTGQPSMNNLHGRTGSSGGNWDRLPGRSRDQSPGTSQGSQGSATGGAPRKAERPDKPASLKAGVFSNDDRPPIGGTGQSYRYPYRPYDPTITDDEDDGVIEGANRLSKWATQQQDEEPEDTTGLGEKVGEVEAPPEGMVLTLVPQPDGMIAILCVPDDGDDDLNTNDRTYRHKISDHRDPILARMNRINRHRSTKDWASTKEVTLYRYKGLLPGERIELQGPNEYGRYDLILFSRTTPLLAGDVVMPSNQQQPNKGSGYPAQNWSASPGNRPGERSIHELDGQISSRTGDRAMTLARMNRLHRAHWAVRT